MIFPEYARAEETAERLLQNMDLSAIEAALETEKNGIDLRETIHLIIKGEWDPASLGKRFLAAADIGNVFAAGTILVPVGIWCVCGAIAGEKGEKIVGNICACVSAAGLSAMLIRAGAMARGLADSTAVLCRSAAPVLATLLSAAGGVNSSSVLTPAASMAAQCCADIVCGVTLPLIGSAGILAAAPAFSQRFAFAGVRRLLISLSNWIHGGLLMLFVSLLGIRGLIKGGADSLTMKTARYTVDSLLPVVGGDIADSLGLLIASAKAVQGGVGIVCCVVLLIQCAVPAFAAGSCLLITRISKAMIEPFGVKSAQQLLEGYADVFRALLVAVASTVMLFFLLAGSSISMARGLF